MTAFERAFAMIDSVQRGVGGFWDFDKHFQALYMSIYMSIYRSLWGLQAFSGVWDC